MTGCHLAQVNIAQLRFPLDAPQVAEFLAAVDRINHLADRSPGFLWRDPDAHRHLHRLAATGPLTIVNVSVWESYEPFHAFVYRSTHGGFVRRRAEWFARIPTPASALWWVPVGHHPTSREALARLKHLRACGPTPRAFSARVRFTRHGQLEGRRQRISGWSERRPTRPKEESSPDV